MTRLLGIGLLVTAWLASLSVMACGGEVEAERIGAAAAGVVQMDIDPEITGNTASTLGTIEDCVRVDGSGGFDAVADHTIDVVVLGDTQAPVAYDAWVLYDTSLVDPVFWADLDKMAPGSVSFTTKTLPALNAGALHLFGSAGTPGDGYIVRVELDIDFTTPGLASFSYKKGAYTSQADGAHPTTTDGAFLAINQDCPAVTPTSSPTPTPTLAPGTPTPLPTPPPGTILLVGGWNNPCYVGPEQPIGDALADIAAQVVAVYRMRADQGFDRWFPDRPEASTMTAVGPYQPLLILMSQYGFWPHEPSGTPSASVPLASGWNNVCHTGQTKSAEDATAGVAGGFVIMYGLDGGQGWSRYVPGRPEVSNIDQLNQYDTVLMLVGQEAGTTWTFDP